MKKTPGNTPAERARFWTNIINKARRDPHGVSAYLKREGIEKDNYYHWFKKLRTEHPEWNDLSKDPVHQSMKTRTKSEEKLPKTEVPEKATRRSWSRSEKERVLNEIDAAGHGQAAAILRKEGVYSSQVKQWRLERAERNLEARKRGPKPNPAAQEIKQLKAQLAAAEKKLARANALIDLQKKVSEMLRTVNESDQD